MPADERRVALFIDADNSPALYIDVILAELARHGTVCIRRAYGNWKSERLNGWESVLNLHAIQPVHQIDYTKGKNATDLALAIDVMDALYGRDIDVFAIASSDSDFTPLAVRLQADGKKVIGFGERKTPAALVNACSTFLYLEQEERGGAAADNGESVAPRDAKALKSDTRLMKLLRTAVHAAEDDQGWAGLSKVGSLIGNQASFDSRNYGYKKLGDLFEAIDLFEVTRRDGHPFVREKKRKTGAPASAESEAEPS
ncbi:NYN domain-containing protein [Niveibacterium sp. SC-1]|uniref:NYN domain-containing protein n=1 Tax=Niveibacterium sp. SC-1 TaxID=3135646 RepID=UPI00311E411A